ncbi:hypothetical protein BDV98DRAFT_569873 [Pterulicium gracile]|uniref:Uncharacterized protein n=1 Tax=Pterulicium gracile TaxID=1884261 RepID=A0A5C3QD94_9AGAR|nr:hypothetical protein BDV98DRAFT_569873 [Pterula gracilis]
MRRPHDSSASAVRRSHAGCYRHTVLAHLLIGQGTGLVYSTELLYVYVCGQSGGEVVDKVLSSVLLKRTVISVRLSDFLFD